jgi:RHS repeat-associated protein
MEIGRCSNSVIFCRQKVINEDGSPELSIDAFAFPIRFNSSVGDGTPGEAIRGQSTYLDRWRDEDEGIGSSRGERFDCNVLGQITRAQYNAQQVWTGNPMNAVVDQSYDVTPLNRNAVWNNGQVTSYAFNALNQYTTVWGSALGYDGNFNLTWRDGVSFGYDGANRLTQASGSGATMQFVYDGLGRCVKRTVNGAVTVIAYDGWKATVEWDGAGNFQAWNLYGAGEDEILWRYEVGFDHLRYHHDIHGNVTSVLAYAGNILERYSYDAFGKPTILSPDGTPRSSSGVGNRFMFQGREWIPELGVYDYRHRMYQPDLGLFLQMDPMGLQTEGEKLSAAQKALYSPDGSAPEAFSSSEMNLFRYCGDDPVNKSDPMGTLWQVDPNLPTDQQQHMQERIDTARKRDSNIDAKLTEWEKNPNAMNTITNAKNPDNTGPTLPDGSKGNSSDYSSSWDHFKGKGNATIFWDPDNWQTLHEGLRDPIIGLGHELPHGDQVNKGTFPARFPVTPAGIAAERQAIQFENAVRANTDGSHRSEVYPFTEITYPPHP